jgi:serine O-acetyltransferase
MKRQILEDFRSLMTRDPAARNLFDLFTLYPGIHALFFHRLSHRLWQWRWFWLARFISNISRFLTGIEIHPGAKIGRRFFIDHGMGVVIGETAEIGDDCTIYHGVTLGGTSWQKGKRHPTLGNGVVIGAGAKVLGPIIVGDYAKIGSNAVVTKDVAAQSTIVGVPGKALEDKQKKEKQQVFAEKIGFCAYGAPQDSNDPVSQSLQRLLEHIQMLDEQVLALQEQIHLLKNEKEQNAGKITQQVNS